MSPTATHTRRGFTLAELVVVVGLIAILTVGIGRLFAGVSEAVGRGLAVSELDAIARSIEENLRRDFERVARMNSDETFLVIRAIELGGDEERPIYLSREDQEADVLAGATPYGAGSRAIHTRLDEMAFLASGSGADAFRSLQDNGFFTGSQPTADAARIYYGHGLRPRLDPNWPLPEPVDADAHTAPLRQFVPDGWFGSRPASMDARDYYPGGPITGRNEFAGDWVLARQALLLRGPDATGSPDPRYGATAVGEDREYAPYVRDLETLHRFWSNLLPDAPSGAERFAWPGPVHSVVSQPLPRPDMRLIAHGRVDLCAQTLAGVRQWLEGESPVWSASQGYAATPFPYEDPGVGALDVPGDPSVEIVPVPRLDLSESDLRSATSPHAVQRWLWRRAADLRTSPQFDPSNPPANLLSVGTNGNPVDDLAYNLIGVRSAIAGVLTRPLLETEPAQDARTDPSTLSGFDDLLLYAQQHDGSMDTHAVLAPRCSRFEIAWSDGSYWVRDTDFDGDGEFDARAGDLVWFDPSRLRPDDDDNDDNALRMTYETMWERYGLDSGFADRVSWATRYTDPQDEELQRVEGPLGGPDDDGGVELNLLPEVGFGSAAYFDSEPTFENAGSGPVRRRLWVKRGSDVTEDSNGAGPSATNPPYYNPDLTGGAPTTQGWPDTTPATPSADISEYLAVWPFRVPGSSGDWGDAYEKNVWVRVRYTLHDPQRRLREGRDYEVVLHMHPHDEHG